ncbi:hypothetical protein PS15m_010795 [Mucor circinelloides]
MVTFSRITEEHELHLCLSILKSRILICLKHQSQIGKISVGLSWITWFPIATVFKRKTNLLPEDRLVGVPFQVEQH